MSKQQTHKHLETVTLLEIGVERILTSIVVPLFYNLFVSDRGFIGSLAYLFLLLWSLLGTALLVRDFYRWLLLHTPWRGRLIFFLVTTFVIPLLYLGLWETQGRIATLFHLLLLMWILIGAMSLIQWLQTQLVSHFAEKSAMQKIIRDNLLLFVALMLGPPPKHSPEGEAGKWMGGIQLAQEQLDHLHRVGI